MSARNHKNQYDNLDNDSFDIENPLYELQSQGRSVSHINYLFSFKNDENSPYPGLKARQWQSHSDPIVRFTSQGLVVDSSDPRSWVDWAWDIYTRLNQMTEGESYFYYRINYVQDDVDTDSDYMKPDSWIVYNGRGDYLTLDNKEIDVWLRKKGY